MTRRPSGQPQVAHRWMIKRTSHYNGKTVDSDDRTVVFDGEDENIVLETHTRSVLSFAVVFLNACGLHDRRTEDEPSVERSVRMDEGTDNDGDSPRKQLIIFYDSIETGPNQIPDYDGNGLMRTTFSDPDHKGWLFKQGGRFKSWKSRWFVLNDTCLYYFKCTSDKKPRGIVPLQNIEVRKVSDCLYPHSFELYAAPKTTGFIKACKTDSEGKYVEGKHTVYRMAAFTAEERDEWFECLKQSIVYFFGMLSERKKKHQQISVQD